MGLMLTLRITCSSKRWRLCWPVLFWESAPPRRRQRELIQGLFILSNLLIIFVVAVVALLFLVRMLRINITRSETRTSSVVTTFDNGPKIRHQTVTTKGLLPWSKTVWTKCVETPSGEWETVESGKGKSPYILSDIWQPGRAARTGR